MAAMNGFWDWVGRVVMLSLAGMITLSIIGAIAAIPSGSLPPEVRFERGERPVPEEAEELRPEVQRPQAADPAGANAAAPGQVVAVAPAPKEEVRPEDWLETIAYALLALVGLAALGTLLLWRALRQWRRSADALEALARRG